MFMEIWTILQSLSLPNLELRKVAWFIKTDQFRLDFIFLCKFAETAQFPFECILCETYQYRINFNLWSISPV